MNKNEGMDFMLKQEIVEMKPGRKLDQLVADRVMGKMIYDVPDLDSLPPGFMLSDDAVRAVMKEMGEAMVLHPKFVGCTIPSYSKEIHYAFEVVSHLRACGKEINIHIGDEVRVALDGLELVGEELPELICKIALLAMNT
jgi:hypothetical protein